MATKTVRILKGLYLGLMYAVFGTGIGLALIFVLPVLRLADKASGPNPERMQRVNRAGFGLWLRLLRLGGLVRTPRYRGAPPPGPCVVVANHPGLFDVLVLIRDIPRLSVLVKGALVRQLPLWRIFVSAGYVVAPKEETFGAVQTLSQAAEMIGRGYSFLIFPEGTRSPIGRMRRFKAGAFRLAGEAGVPILPVLIRNDPPFLPKEERWYYPPRRRCTIEMDLWEPIPPPETGRERELAAELEERYRRALGVGPAGERDADGERTRGGGLAAAHGGVGGAGSLGAIRS